MTLDAHAQLVLSGHKKAADLTIEVACCASIVVAVDGGLFIEGEFCPEEFADGVERSVGFEDDGLWFVDVDQEDTVVSCFHRADQPRFTVLKLIALCGAIRFDVDFVGPFFAFEGVDFEEVMTDFEFGEKGALIGS